MFRMMESSKCSSESEHRWGKGTCTEFGGDRINA